MKRILNLDLTVGIGEGSMLVDGREIYTAKGLKVGLFKDIETFDMRSSCHRNRNSLKLR